MPNGTYTFDSKGDYTFQSAVSLLREGNYSTDELRSLLELAKQAQVTQSVRDEFTSHANEIAPGLGDRLEQFFDSRKYTVAALSVLIAVIVFLAPYFKSDPPATPTPTTINNTYNIVMPGTPSAKKLEVERRRLKKIPGKPGSNITPPLSKKARSKRRK